MTESPTPNPYKVVYSQFVRDSLRDLLAKARAAGQGKKYFQAAKEIASRLQIYPQFGEPMMDLSHPSAQIWIGTIGPLVVRYAIYEDRRLVTVVVPIMPLPNSGL